MILPKAKLCELCKWEDYHGYGFSLHGIKDSVGQFITEVDPNSPAYFAGLRDDDFLIEVNGINVLSEPHPEVVERIKSNPHRVCLLVVDPTAKEYFAKGQIIVDSHMEQLAHFSTPAVRPAVNNIDVVAVATDSVSEEGTRNRLVSLAMKAERSPSATDIECIHEPVLPKEVSSPANSFATGRSNEIVNQTQAVTSADDVSGICLQIDAVIDSHTNETTSPVRVLMEPQVNTTSVEQAMSPQPDVVEEMLSVLEEASSFHRSGVDDRENKENRTITFSEDIHVSRSDSRRSKDSLTSQINDTEVHTSELSETVHLETSVSESTIALERNDTKIAESPNAIEGCVSPGVSLLEIKHRMMIGRKKDRIPSSSFAERRALFEKL